MLNLILHSLLTKPFLLGSLDSGFPQTSFDTIPRSDTSATRNTPETSTVEGYSYQQQVLDDIIRQRNIEDFIRYRNGKDQELQRTTPEPTTLQPSQLQQQPTQLQIQQPAQPQQQSYPDFTTKSDSD